MKLKTLIIAITALAATLSLGACANDGSWNMGNKETVGTGAGAVIGGILGSRVGKGGGQLWATGAGALLGAYLGNSIGKSLDKADRMYQQQAVNQAYDAPLNQTIKWDNQKSGHSGTVTPIREGRQASTGNVCRKFEQIIYIDGQKETAVGSACKNEDGTWTVAN